MTEPARREGDARDVLDTALRFAPCAVLTVDPSGVVVQLNEAARRLLDVPPGRALSDSAPGWLADAQRSLAEPAAAETSPAGAVARGPIGDHVFEAHPVPEAGPPGTPGPTSWWLVDVTERERTAFLAEASDELLASLNLERCMEVTARLAARYFADAAVVIVPHSGRGHPVARCGPDGHVEHRKLLLDPAEVEGLAEAMRGFPPMPPRWIDPSTAPAWLARPAPAAPAGMVVIALPGHGVPAGALVLLRRSGRETFSAGEERTVRLFAGRAGAVLSAARLYAEQASITTTLMRELMPPRTHPLRGVEVAARYRPAGDEDLVGGDFYDVYPAADDDPEAESLVVLGDVCGKGLEAAVLTGQIRNTLRALLPMAGDHRRVLELLNGALLHSDATRFVTLVLASARGLDARVRLRVTSAGHAAPLIVRSGGTVEAARTGGSLIGVLEEIDSTTAEVTLDPGDSCLLYTDGITEAVGGPLGDEMFGDERLCAELGRCGGMPPEALVERVHMLAAEWVGARRHDDMAVIAITAPRHVRSGGPEPGEGTG
ncbi:PP2C family protein-serine/threonine phosphatase [Actinomadura algeriensis]|uniref:Serine phosphatase RsbU (Regulator of sigma subunit) n=1 Tax=Actinomadura algeriensis TaxID=1679523 RepID=A0ABR9JLA8_9ACTN|nr:SpoIIE family protein phosphatase [Actinomadura algeriensis]MBE1531166.1 serine phosphatase RsbU (regulator of sigma subunit) [Actinomadura algeriensis]